MRRNKILWVLALLLTPSLCWAEEVIEEALDETELVVEHQHEDDPYQKEQKSIFDILFGSDEDKKVEPHQNSEHVDVPKYEEVPKDGDFRSYAKIRVLDKTLGKVYNYKIKVGNHIQFNELVVRALSCWTPNYPTLIPEARGLVEVYDSSLPSKKRVFYGWMFSNSSSAASLEHPKFDVQVANCENSPPVVEKELTENSPQQEEKDVAKSTKKPPNNKNK